MEYNTPRLIAKAAGLTRYEGLPCIHCGGTTRYVSGQACVPCKQDKKYKAAKDKRGKNKKPPKTEEELKDIKREYHRLYRQRPDQKERVRQYRNLPENKCKIVAKKARHRAEKLHRVPKWLTENDSWMIKEIYELAMLRSILTGVEWQVDHIIPLRGKRVSGLHVPTNMQVITAKENLKKRATYNI